MKLVSCKQSPIQSSTYFNDKSNNGHSKKKKKKGVWLIVPQNALEAEVTGPSLDDPTCYWIINLPPYVLATLYKPKTQTPANPLKGIIKHHQQTKTPLQQPHESHLCVV